jgi:hypothetical protein
MLIGLAVKRFQIKYIKMPIKRIPESLNASANDKGNETRRKISEGLIVNRMIIMMMMR